MCLVFRDTSTDDDSYNMIKKQMQGGDPNYRTSSGQHLLAAAEASESLNDGAVITKATGQAVGLWRDRLTG